MNCSWIPASRDQLGKRVTSWQGEFIFISKRMWPFFYTVV